MENTTLNLVILLVYMGGLMGFGLYQGMKVKNTTDLNMGGRAVPG